MGWSVVLPGQPPSLNSLYTMAFRRDRGGRVYKGVGKNPVARTYHDQMAMVIRAARPSGWNPEGMVRLSIRLFLTHDIDADNVLKVLSDAIETATGVNDKRFLPTVECKHTGLPLGQARVELTVSEEEPHSHGVQGA